MWFRRKSASEAAPIPTPFGDTSVLDAVFSQDGVAVLLLGQVDDWGEPDIYLTAIREKMSAYVEYVVDGHLAAAYPDLAGAPAKVVLWCQSQPPQPLRDWVSSLQPVLAQEHPDMTVEIQLSPRAAAQ